MKKVIILLLCFANCIFAQEVTNQEVDKKVKSDCPDNVELDVTEQEKDDLSMTNFISADSVIISRKVIEMRDSYLKEKGLRLGFNPDGSYVGWGQSDISVSPKRIDFAQKRALAFEKAFIDAKGEFVKSQKHFYEVEVVRNFFNTDIDFNNNQELRESTATVISKKVQALTEAQLDQKLLELGIDPDSIANSDIKSKQEIATNSLRKEVAIKAVESVKGVIILKTIHDMNNVGVLIKYSSRYDSLAQAMISDKLVGYPAKTAPADSITRQLNEICPNDEDLISVYGVRILVDEYGNRVIASFGQYSPLVSKADSDMKKQNAFKAAKMKAASIAESYMMQFKKTTLALSEIATLQDSDSITLLEKDNGFEEVSSSTVGSSIEDYIRETSAGKFKGVTTIRDWVANDPVTGHLIFGQVVLWTPEFQRPTETITDNSDVYDNVDPFGSKEIGNDW